jgi:predicted alpha/beta superfamily hydrolase
MSSIQIIRGFHSPQEGFDRTLRIYVPEGYDPSSERRYPVLYMHDGQNVFAHPESARYDTWCTNRVLDAMVHEGHAEPWIVVAVDHGANRLGEYSPWDEPRSHVTARGEPYVRFIVDTLKPFVDSHFRTRPGPEWTGLMGSSMGGLISLYLGWRYPELFGRIGGMSPSVMWSYGRLFEEWTSHTRRWTRIYLDAGTDENVAPVGWPMFYGQATRDFYVHLKGLGYADHELALVLEPGGYHHERDWQRRLPTALRWLLS